MVSHKAHFVVLIGCHFGPSSMTKQALHMVIPGIDVDRNVRIS